LLSWTFSQWATKADAANRALFLVFSIEVHYNGHYTTASKIPGFLGTGGHGLDRLKMVFETRNHPAKRVHHRVRARK
jgi:hypothetical protein